MSQLHSNAKPYPNFSSAAKETMHLLQRLLGINTWMTTRKVGDDWIMLSTESASESTIHPGDVLIWEDSVCARMVQGQGPLVAPDLAQVPTYFSAPITRELGLRSYIGAPLFSADGELFGTLCASDQHTHVIDVSFAEELVTHFARILSNFIQLETRKQVEQVYEDNVRAYGMIDLETGLPNSFAWEFLVEREEERCRQLGTPVSTVLLSFHGEQTVTKMRQAATILTGMLRPEDVIARISDHEVAMLMRATSAPTAEHASLRVRSELRESKIECAMGWDTRHPSKGLAECVESARMRCQSASERWAS